MKFSPSNYLTTWLLLVKHLLHSGWWLVRLEGWQLFSDMWWRDFRVCDNPTPSCRGKQHSGLKEDIEECNETPCEN